MTEHVKIPVRAHGGKKWGALSFIQEDHEIVGYSFSRAHDHYPFIAGHRVRLFKVSGNVHFLVPSGAEFDISAVVPHAAPRRQPAQRHNKKR